MENKEKKNPKNMIIFILLLLVILFVGYYLVKRGVPVETAVVYETEEACKVLGKCECVPETCKNDSFGKIFVECTTGWKCDEQY